MGKGSGTLRLTVAAIALAGLLFGFDTVVIAGVTDAVRRLFVLSPGELGFTVASALLGTFAGALAAGVGGDRLGSRDGLRWAALFYLVAGIGCAAAWDWTSLVLFRMLCGFAIGISSVLAPVYLAEVAPAQHRGRLVGMFQVNIVVGIVLAYVSNYAIGRIGLGADEWRWKLGLTALPALVFFAVLFLVPDSPRWLTLKGRHAEALAADVALRGSDAVSEAYAVAAQGHLRLRDFWHEARRPILLAVTLAVFNQLTGINAVLYYLNDIFAAAGFGRVASDLQSIAIGLTNLLFTLLAMTVIDRLGRRRMLLVGSAGMAAMLGVAALVMLDLAPRAWLLGVLVLFIAAFAFSQGAVIWVYISEIFPARYRAAGQGVGAGAIWLADAAVAQGYPVIAAQSKSTPFVFFMAVMVVQGIVVWRFFPETRGLTLETLGARMGGAA